MPEKNLLKMRSRAIYTLYFVALLDLLAVSLFLPLISREIKDLGASPFMVGLIGSIYGAIQLFSSPLVGRESDKYGRKFVIIAMLAATALAYTIQGSATSLGLLLVGRCLAGLFKHTQTLGKAMLADLAPHEKSYVFGNVNAFGSMGYIVGPTIGGHLVAYENGFHNVCYLAAVIFVFNMILVTLMVPETQVRRTEEAKAKEKSATDGNGNTCCDVDIGTMSKTTIVAVLVLRFLFSFATLAPRANLPLIFDNKFQASIISQGYLNSLQALTGTVTGFCVGPIVSKLYREQHRSMVLHGGLIHTIALFGLFFAPSFELAGLCLVFVSATNPFQRVGITALSLSTTEDPGAILGLGQTATSLARMLAPVTAGAAQSISDDGPALLGCVSAFIGVVCIFFFIPSNLTPVTNNQYVKQKSS